MKINPSAGMLIRDVNAGQIAVSSDNAGNPRNGKDGIKCVDFGHREYTFVVGGFAGANAERRTIASGNIP